MLMISFSENKGFAHLTLDAVLFCNKLYFFQAVYWYTENCRKNHLFKGQSKAHDKSVRLNTQKHFVLKNDLGNEDDSFGILPLWGWHKTAIDFSGWRFHLWFSFFCTHMLKTLEIPPYMPTVHMDNYLMIL